MALKLVHNHGPRRLLSGAGATFTGYFLHGAFKYGSLVEWSEDETNDPTSFVEGYILYAFVYRLRLCIYS